jgi:hypothetical protein
VKYLAYHALGARLSLHVFRRITSSVLESFDVVDDVAWAAAKVGLATAEDAILSQKFEQHDSAGGGNIQRVLLSEHGNSYVRVGPG